MSRSEQFFHGTDADIAVGDHIRPGYSTATGATDVAHATDNETVAWGYALNRGGRGRVYEVEKHPDAQPGFYNRARNRRVQHLGEWTAPSFKVKCQIDVMPGHQGTFPQLNWRQFDKTDTGEHDRANHPNPYDTADADERRSMASDNGRMPKREGLPGQGRLF